jgi:hypothetical protein
MGKSTETHGFSTGLVVTPSDGADIPGGAVRGFVVGVSGNVRTTMPDGTDVTWPSLAAGVTHPIQCIRIWATGTTATTIVAGR